MLGQFYVKTKETTVQPQFNCSGMCMFSRLAFCCAQFDNKCSQLLSSESSNLIAAVIIFEKASVSYHLMAHGRGRFLLPSSVYLSAQTIH